VQVLGCRKHWLISAKWRRYRKQRRLERERMRRNKRRDRELQIENLKFQMRGGIDGGSGELQSAQEGVGFRV
jgi:hypothetical protein